MSAFLVRHRVSIYMTMLQLILASVMMRPAFTSFVILGALAGMMILTREVAMEEGRTHPPTVRIVALGVGTICLALLFAAAAVHFIPALMVVD